MGIQTIGAGDETESVAWLISDRDSLCCDGLVGGCARAGGEHIGGIVQGTAKSVEALSRVDYDYCPPLIRKSLVAGPVRNRLRADENGVGVRIEDTKAKTGRGYVNGSSRARDRASFGVLVEDVC